MRASKDKTTSLIILTFLSAMLCWLPVIIVPNLDLPAWLPLTIVALSAAFAAFLDHEHWLLFVPVATIGSFVGLFIGLSVGNLMRPWLDKAAVAIPLFTAVGSAAAAVVALVGSFVASRLSVQTQALRKVTWFALIAILALGPAGLAVTPPLVARRVAHNERMAVERLQSLQQAVARTLTGGSSQAEICDGSALARKYTGPAFSEEDWRRITGNYVKQDGYFFMIYCREKDGYTIDAHPVMYAQDGNRNFCSDESGTIGCGMEWDRTRHACVACRKNIS